ncbi:MAG: class B sortase [Clostridia bacterium]|nr:class B sortase [Clostridia bacterium]
MGKYGFEKKNKITNNSLDKKINTKLNNNLRSKIISIIQILFLIILIITGIVIIKYFIDSNANNKILNNIEQTVTVVDKEVNSNKKEDGQKKYEVDFSKLKEINNETVAWIKVNNTKIEYPVVKTNNNSYYLTHNFEKKFNRAGWIFADYRNKFDGTDKNIVIHGHNMRDNNMFGSLKNVINKDWYDNEENKYITFITETQNAIYEVFSVYQIEKEDYYLQTRFYGNKFSEFINTIKSRSIKNFKVEITSQDSILTLSTCADNNNYRVVLHAKKI